jgi:hypothetical protein
MSIGDPSVDSGVRLVLHLLDGTDTIEGRVEDDAGRERPFRGWLELTALLDAACPRAQQPVAAEEW